MTESDYWALIERIDNEALRAGDEETALEPLEDSLRELSDDALRQFQEHLAQSLFKLDGKVYADNAGKSGQSGDGFLYSRCFVVGCGRSTFDATLADPILMPKSLDHWLESILYCAVEVLADRLDDAEIETTVSYETGSNEAQW